MFMLPWSYSFIMVSGIAFGYCFYEVAHIYSHGHPLVQSWKFLDVAADYHMAHHRVNSRTNFGFCSPFCDFINGTILDKGDLNPFKISEMRKSAVGFFAGLPLPIPFYHWIFMYLKRQSIYHKDDQTERIAGPSTDKNPVTDTQLE